MGGVGVGGVGVGGVGVGTRAELIDAPNSAPKVVVAT